MFVVGVDGCRAGWIAVALEDGRFAGASMFESFRGLCDAVPDAVVLAVDIPIGFAGGQERACDRLVREWVASRNSSVFPTPPRQVLEAPSYEVAVQVARRTTGKGVSRQSYALARKILEVDRVVRETRFAKSVPAPGLRPVTERFARRPPVATAIADGIRDVGTPATREGRAARARRYARVIPSPTSRRDMARPDEQGRESVPPAGGRIVEAHPEASFRELLGAALLEPKGTPDGLELRRKLLRGAGITIPEEMDLIGGVGRDDVLDATAVAWTAERYASGQARSLPAVGQWQHDGDRVVAIWI